MIEWSLMTLDISVEFFNHTLLLFRFAAVHLHSCTSERHFYGVVRTLINRHDGYANSPSWDSFHNVENDIFLQPHTFDFALTLEVNQLTCILP